MGLELAKAFVSIRGDASHFASDVRSQTPVIQNAVQSISSKVGAIMGGLGLGLGIAQLVGVFRAADDAADEFERSGIKMNLMLRNAGEHIGFTSDQLKSWIEEISSVSTTWDTELNAAAMGMMMFESIQGEVFHRTLKAAEDLGVVLGSMSGAARMLGRAMEDPARGMMFLRRAGIILTAEQQNQIKAFAASGEKAKAQAALLDIIEKKTKGMAAEYAKSSQGQEDMADKMLALTKRNMGAMWSPVGVFITKTQTAFYEAVTRVGSVVEFIVSGLSKWNGSMDGIPSKFIGITISVMGLTVAISLAGSALKAAFALSPIGRLAIAISGVVAGIYIWLEKTGRLKEVSANGFIYIKTGLTLLGQLFNSIASMIMDVWEVATTYIAEGWRVSIDYISGLLEPLKNTFGKMVTNLITNLDVMLGSWAGLREGIIQIAYQTVLGFQAVWEVSRSFMEDLCADIRSLWDELWISLKSGWVSWETMLLGSKIYQQIAGRLAVALSGTTGDEAVRLFDETVAEMQQRATQGPARQDALEAERKGKRKDAAEQSAERQKKHDAAMAAIGQESIDATKAWIDKMGKLPTLSEKWQATWDAIKAAAAAAFDKAKKPGLPGAAAGGIHGKREWAFEGSTAASDLGRRLQDALLKPKDKNLDEAKKGNALQEKANVDLAAMRAKLDKIGGLV